MAGPCSPNSLLLGFYVRKRKELATFTGRAPELCGWAVWLGFVAGPCPSLVLLLAVPLKTPSTLWLGFVAGPCPPLGRAPEFCQLCGWPLWLGLVLLLAAPELCQLCGWALWLGLVLLLAAS